MICERLMFDKNEFYWAIGSYWLGICNLFEVDIEGTLSTALSLTWYRNATNENVGHKNEVATSNWNKPTVIKCLSHRLECCLSNNRRMITE